MSRLPRTLIVWLVAAVSAGALTAAPRAQSGLDLSKPPTDTTRVETRHLTLTTAIGEGGVKDGRAELVLHVVPKAKMHVYAPDQDDYIPLTLTVASIGRVKAGKPQFPPAEQYFFEPLKETQRVFSKPFKVTVPVTLTASATSPLTVSGSVRYQACDDRICYVPQTVAVSWTLPAPREGRER